MESLAVFMLVLEYFMNIIKPEKALPMWETTVRSAYL